GVGGFHDALHFVGEDVEIVIVPGARGSARRCALEDQGHRTCASARRPAPVIRRRVTSIDRLLASICSVLAVASPARTSSTSSSILNPCASMMASVQPSRDVSSNSSARRRLRRLGGGVGISVRPTHYHRPALRWSLGAPEPED